MYTWLTVTYIVLRDQLGSVGSTIVVGSQVQAGLTLH